MASNQNRETVVQPEYVAGVSYTPKENEYVQKEDPLEAEVFDQAPSVPQEEARLFSASTMKIAIPTILVPLLYGYNIGLVGPYMTLYTYATDCQMYGAQTSCETLSGSKCKWMDATSVNASSTLGMVCGWESKSTCYLKYDTVASCGADSDCVWSYTDGTCGNKVGYTSILSGLFSGSMIIGATIGSLTGGYLTKWLDYRKSYFIIGVISLVGAIMTHIATGLFVYWLLFVGRIVVGFAMGWQAITAPHYTGRFSPKPLQKTLGTYFQIFITVGLFLAAVFAILLGNTIGYNSDRNANVMGRMQGLMAPPTLMSIMVMFLPLITKNGYSLVDGEPYGEGESENAAAPRRTQKTYSFCSMMGPILMGLTMATTAQLTGINAVMNYAPTIMSNLGLDGLVGNIILMAWNAVTPFAAIPLSKKFSMRTLFLSCSLLGSVFCLFLGGIPVYPGVTKVTLVKEVVAIIGIALFIAVYEFGIGPCFYVLAMDVFPESFRPIGSSITTGVMMAFNMVINICYPIATEGISGGPSGNQDKGQAIAFIFFGGIGFVAFAIEYFFLFPFEEKGDTVAEQDTETGMDAK